MGYEARIEFTDATLHRWRGGHRPDHADLSALFRHLTELDPGALADDPPARGGSTRSDDAQTRGASNRGDHAQTRSASNRGDDAQARSALNRDATGDDAPARGAPSRDATGDDAPARGASNRGAARGDDAAARDGSMRGASTESDAQARAGADLGWAREDVWRLVLPTGAQVVSVLGKRAARIRMPAAPISRELVVKLVLPRAGVGALAWAARERSRAHRAHLWAHRLRAFGVATPRPLGWLERASRARRHVSFVVSEYVSAPTLHAVIEGGLSMAAKRALIGRVADTLRTMHSQGVFHGDLHAENLLIDDQDVLVIDLESMRRVALAGRAQERNLVRLNRAFLDPARITRTDRMRFLRDYLRGAPDAHAQARGLFADVLAETRSKLAERGERFVDPIDDEAPTLPPT